MDMQSRTGLWMKACVAQRMAMEASPDSPFYSEAWKKAGEAWRAIAEASVNAPLDAQVYLGLQQHCERKANGG